MSHICNFCKNEYTTEGNLIKHQKTAKFCLKIQNPKKIEKNGKQTIIACEFCNKDFSTKYDRNKHHETCKIKLNKLQNEKEEKYKEELSIKNENIIKLQEEINIYKTELRIKDEQLKMKDDKLSMKDDIISKLEKENESLKQENKDTFMTLLDRSDKTYNKFFEKEEKLVDTLLQQNNSSKQSKTVQNHLTIHNYGIKPLTAESVINAFESFSSRSSTAFNAFQYDGITLERGSMKLEFVFFGIIRELKDYYGITDISREKVIFNNNGEMTLTTVQEFIRTNIVMNNIDLILEWISNLLSQIRQRIEDGNIDINGEMREMTEIEKNKLSDTGESLEYIYKLFKVSKDKGMANNYMTKLLSDGAIKEGKVISKVPTLKGNLKLKE
jgi:hypothetical protein